MTETEKARIIDAIEEVQWWHLLDDGRIMPGAERDEKALCRYMDVIAAIRKAIESDKNYVAEDVYDAVYEKQEQAEISLLLLKRMIIADLKEVRQHISTMDLITELIKKYEAKCEEEN
jgi:uncharacterized FlgJ-related protein